MWAVENYFLLMNMNEAESGFMPFGQRILDPVAIGSKVGTDQRALLREAKNVNKLSVCQLRFHHLHVGGHEGRGANFHELHALG